MLDVIANEIVDKVLEDLSGRRGIFDDVDDDIMEEIRESLYDIVVKELL